MIYAISNTDSWNNYFFKQLEGDLQELEDNRIEANREKPLKSTLDVFSFANLDQRTFQKNLKAYNKKVSTFAQMVLQREFPELKEIEDVCLATTGSDGRREKLCLLASPIELTLIVNKRTDLNDSLIQKVNKIIHKHSTLFFNNLEIKCLEDGKLMYFDRRKDFNNPDYHPYPMRALDARYLAGSEIMMVQYQQQFFQELKQPCSLKLIKKFSDTKRVAFKDLKEAIQGDASHIDVKTGTLHYDGSRIKATKYALLRAVQFPVVIQICKLVNQDKVDWETFSKIPKGTMKRVQWLFEQKLLDISQPEIEDLKKAYSASLIWLEQAQRSFEVKKEQNSCVPSAELTRVVEIIDRLKNKLMIGD